MSQPKSVFSLENIGRKEDAQKKCVIYEKLSVSFKLGLDFNNGRTANLIMFWPNQPRRIPFPLLLSMLALCEATS